MTCMRGITVFVLFGFAGVAWADDPASKGGPPAAPRTPSSQEMLAQQKITLAKQNYDSGRKELADQLYAEVQAQFPEKSFTYYWRGRIAFEEKRYPAASAQFHQYLKIRGIPADGSAGQREPDANALEAISDIERCEGKGGIRITSDPDHAAVRIDDEKAPPAGPTPFERRQLPTGAHSIFVVRQDHKQTRVTVVVKPGEVAEKHVVLERMAVVILPSAEKRPLAPPVTAASKSSPKEARKLPGLDEDEKDLDKFHPAVPVPPSPPPPPVVVPPPPPPAAPPPEAPKWYKKPWVWGVIAGGAVLVGGGAVAGAYVGTRDPLDYMWTAEH